MLLDVDDVSAGHHTVMRWNGEEQWVWSADPVHEALVSLETFQALQATSTTIASLLVDVLRIEDPGKPSVDMWSRSRSRR